MSASPLPGVGREVSGAEDNGQSRADFCRRRRAVRFIEVEQLFYVNPETGVQFLRARCQYTVNQNECGIGDDTRNLGVFLSSVLCEPIV